MKIMVVWKLNHYPRSILFSEMAEPRISTEEAAVSLKLQSDGSLERQQGLSGYPTDVLHIYPDEKTYSPSPILIFFSSGGCDGILTKINLNISKFTQIS